ncbi:hypothetical protein FHS83_002296 [Rhizomicrobium palustre]|uniref:Uncharacterized protein n=1 Tax=Rhizomicrobium palustre TaxID=189966 RepID=A0A846MZC8_9PROT|nr:hypothetical protein [Rhizomicrobium palustre]NIK88978.1 hypothetical protein [Rhizomicrobium palustre]
MALQVALPVDPDLPEATQLPPRREVMRITPMKTNYPEILQRPIFSSDRHPMMEPMSGLTLVGVGIAGNKATALLQDVNGPVIRGRPGDIAAGWSITSIAPDRVLFERKGERRILKIDVQSHGAIQSTVAEAGKK